MKHILDFSFGHLIFWQEVITADVHFLPTTTDESRNLSAPQHPCLICALLKISHIAYTFPVYMTHCSVFEFGGLLSLFKIVLSQAYILGLNYDYLPVAVIVSKSEMLKL